MNIIQKTKSRIANTLEHDEQTLRILLIRKITPNIFFLNSKCELLKKTTYSKIYIKSHSKFISHFCCRTLTFINA